MAEASKKDISDKNSALEKRIKKHVIGKPHRFIAVAPLGFEETLAEELKYIGIECSSNISSSGSADATIAAGIKVAGDGKVEFTAKITEAWKAVAYSRIANRVLMEIGSFKAENFGQLEKGVAGVPWELFLPSDCLGENGAGLVLHTSCKHSRLYHSDAVEERVRKVIGAIPMSSDVIPAQAGIPSPSQHLYVTLIDDRCTLWLDLAGEELYKRGHERFVAEAPLKETIAAAMIFEACRLQVPGSRLQASGDNTASATPQSERCERPHTSKRSDLITFIDPMAGSGTFSLETAYIANGLIPGKCRDFALKYQPAFKEGTWNFILKGSSNVIASEAKQSKQSSPTLKIITSDISERPVSIIKHNVECSPLAEIAKTNPNAVTINPQLKDFFSYSIDNICAVQPPENQSSIINHQSSIILLNPPYGKRLAFDAPKLYTKIGLKLNEFKGAVIAILAPKDCTENLLKACPALDPHHNDTVKTIETSHGGFSLNAIFAKI
ncbi:MAG: RNA methyltransferase [Fibrobacter sp.]|nr:RNA methyltransferase [Fibrobacter sp.]